MSWTYRIVKTKHPSGEDCYSIRECYFTEKGMDPYEDDPSMYQVVAPTVSSENQSDLGWILAKMGLARNRPIVDKTEDSLTPEYLRAQCVNLHADLCLCVEALGLEEEYKELLALGDKICPVR